MKALITGIGGFVGPYMARNLLDNNYSVFGFDRQKADIPGCQCIAADITDEAAVENAIADVNPDIIFHLAGQSSVERSYKEPELTYKINVEGTNNLFAALINCNLKPKVLIVSSSDVYGTPVSVPISEEAELSPKSPYAKSRVEQEEVALRYNEEFGIPVVISRSFSHTGVGQQDKFVCPNFARQVALVKKGRQATIKVGNIDVKRDFSDVRNIVEAYRLLAEKGVPGEIYNVGSGKSIHLRKVVEILLREAGAKAEVEIDPSRVRKDDPDEIVADITKIKSLGWKQKIPFEQTLKGMLDYWLGKF
jgi:GDP-4-dehydro-6-deoxy-D-mannose reductase